MEKPTTLNSYVDKLRQILHAGRKSINAVFYDEIARRAFINNAFDGALTLLGILMGNLILGELDPKIVISTGFSACLAMGISGTFGRYFSEKAERKAALRQMESYMFTDLSGSAIARESEKKVVLISFVDGLSPALAAAIPLIPFFLAQATIISIPTSIVASLVMDFLVLFVLGAILGKISDENIILHGCQVMAVGFITSLIILLSSYWLS